MGQRLSYEQVLRRQLLLGDSVEDAAVAAGVSRSTAFRFLEAHRAELVAETLRASPLRRFLGPVGLPLPRRRRAANG